MICLTGDIHHMSLKTNDQKYLNISEVEAAIEYASIAKDFGIKATFFATGKSVGEERSNFKSLLEYPNIELGGHNYYAFRPKWLYNGVFNRMIGLSNGPVFYQNYEVKKTIRIFKKLLGIKIISWRNHAYRHDRNTYRLLFENGIRFVSDEVDPIKLKPYRRYEGIYSVPINVLPDHDHIYHPDLTPETTKNWSLARDKFSPTFYNIDDWFEIIKGQITAVMKMDGIATVLVHPACMKIVDNFKIFKQLCRLICQYKTMFMRKLINNQEIGVNI